MTTYTVTEESDEMTHTFEHGIDLALYFWKKYKQQILEQEMFDQYVDIKEHDVNELPGEVLQAFESSKNLSKSQFTNI